MKTSRPSDPPISETELHRLPHSDSNGAHSAQNGAESAATEAYPSPSTAPADFVGPNSLNELGEKIFLDRYALKDMTKATLAIGDTVVVCVDLKSGQREIGRVKLMGDGQVTVQLRDGTILERAIENVDKPLELHPEQMMDRVARGIAGGEGSRAEEWFRNFRWLLDGWKFIPGGRILTAAGSDQQLTYYNCYVVPSPKDSRRGIVDTLSQMMEIMSRGGGVGINVSSLRSRHSYVKGVNGRSSGSVSWGALYSFVTGLIEQGGSRRGALMLILNCWHPDVMEFIGSKREAGRITNANISVGITDDFMEAVKADSDWPLVFPDTNDPDYETLWDGDLNKWRSFGKAVLTHKVVRARDVWNAIIESAWTSAEPGVFFVDRYNKMSNSWYFSPILCTNPCGEQGLPAWGVCNLGALNLGKFVTGETVGAGEVDWETLGTAVRYATRFLDNVIDSTPYFFDENRKQQTNERRVGMGVMGLADMLIRLGIRYGSAEGSAFLDKLFGFIAEEAYLASAEIASEKGSFPKFDADKFLQSGFMRQMPDKVRDAIKKKGCRNVTLLTVAPTGTTGTMVGTSTGVEPFFFWSYYRKSRLGMHEENVAVLKEFKDQSGPDASLPEYFTTAMDLTPEEHVRSQAAVQRWIDSSISKCVTGETLVMTRDGLRRISALSKNRSPDSFQDLDIEVMTPFGWARTDAYYYGGVCETHRIALQGGFSLEGTPNHRIQRLDPDGSIRFCRLDGLSEGDTVVLYSGNRVFGKAEGDLPRPSVDADARAKTTRYPENLSEDLAYLLGCIASEGCLTRNGVQITHSDRKLLLRLNDLFTGLFGFGGAVYSDHRRESVHSLQVNSRPLRRWLVDDIGVGVHADGKRIPDCILSGSEREIRAFLRGIFLDGYVIQSGRMFGITLASEGAIRDLQTLLLNFGVVASVSRTADRAWALAVQGESLEELSQFVEFDEPWKTERIARRNQTRSLNLANRMTRLPEQLTVLLRDAQSRSGRSLRGVFGEGQRYYRIRHAFTRGSRLRREDAVALWQTLLPLETPELDVFFQTDKMGRIYLPVRTIEAGRQEVFDLSVPDARSFVANGMGNHNTCNVPKNYTIEQTRELYEMMYELGCKGGTIYRDGSRDEQVLNLKEEPKVDAPVPEAKIVKVRERPYKRYGVTVSQPSPSGTAHITMNDDADGRPFEVFVDIGKGGSDIKAMAEAMGRLMSLVLRLASPLSPKERIEEIINQIKGIGGARSLGFGKNRVRSLPDAVALALEEHYRVHGEPGAAPAEAATAGGDVDSPEANGLHVQVLNGNGNGTVRTARVAADLCPSCGIASFIRKEGCHTCESCGYSEC